jgi:hypothetical protein
MDLALPSRKGTREREACVLVTPVVKALVNDARPLKLVHGAAGPQKYVFSLFRDESQDDGGWWRLAFYATLMVMNVKVGPALNLSETQAFVSLCVGLSGAWLLACMQAMAELFPLSHFRLYVDNSVPIAFLQDLIKLKPGFFEVGLGDSTFTSGVVGGNHVLHLDRLSVFVMSPLGGLGPAPSGGHPAPRPFHSLLSGSHSR